MASIPLFEFFKNNFGGSDHCGDTLFFRRERNAQGIVQLQV